MTNQVETNRATINPAKGALVLPDWAPWSVLVALVSFGVLGGLGIIPLRGPGQPRIQSGALAAQTATAKATTPATNGPRVFLKDAGAPGVQAPSTGASASASQDAKVAVAHLVVSHKDTSLGKHKKIARTREEAMKRAEEALKRAKKGEDFGKLVAEYSDEPGAAERDGKFGKFRHKDAVKPFADAAFALKPGELSPLVESAFGFHVIRRTE